MEKDWFTNQLDDELGLGKLLQHLEKQEPMLFVTVRKGAAAPEANHARQLELRSIIKRAHFGTNKITGYYLDEQGHQEISEELVLYGSKEREQELKNLAIGIGRKFALDRIIYIYGNRRITNIKSRGGCFGTETEAAHSITLKALESYYSHVGRGKFVIKSIGEARPPLYGSWMTAMVCNSWRAFAKKYGADALAAWDNQVK
ncbi:MAG: hypothetical protein ACI3WS_08010 [Phascolarctobacterium sp.]